MNKVILKANSGVCLNHTRPDIHSLANVSDYHVSIYSFSLPHWSRLKWWRFLNFDEKGLTSFWLTMIKIDNCIVKNLLPFDSTSPGKLQLSKLYNLSSTLKTVISVFLKWSLTCMRVLSTCMHVLHFMIGTHGGKKRALDPLELQLRSLWDSMWALGNNPRYSARTPIALNS